MKGTLVHVDCTYSPGMFDSEYAILLAVENDQKVSLFADKNLVVVNGVEHHGFLKATALGDLNSSVVDVLLPNETQLGTRLVGVPSQHVKPAKAA